MVAGLVLLAWVFFGAVSAIATMRLVRRVWKTRERASFATKLVVVVVVAAATFGALGTLIGMAKAFGAVGGESRDPSQKARILAEGISEAMNCTAFGVLLWVPSIIVAFILLKRGGRKRRPEGLDVTG